MFSQVFIGRAPPAEREMKVAQAQNGEKMARKGQSGEKAKNSGGCGGLDYEFRGVTCGVNEDL
jgi:hypothetical protein